MPLIDPAQPVVTQITVHKGPVAKIGAHALFSPSYL